MQKQFHYGKDSLEESTKKSKGAPIVCLLWFSGAFSRWFSFFSQRIIQANWNASLQTMFGLAIGQMCLRWEQEIKEVLCSRPVHISVRETLLQFNMKQWHSWHLLITVVILRNAKCTPRKRLENTILGLCRQQPDLRPYEICSNFFQIPFISEFCVLQSKHILSSERVCNHVVG